MKTLCCNCQGDPANVGPIDDNGLCGFCRPETEMNKHWDLKGWEDEMVEMEKEKQ